MLKPSAGIASTESRYQHEVCVVSGSTLESHIIVVTPPIPKKRHFRHYVHSIDATKAATASSSSFTRRENRDVVFITVTSSTPRQKHHLYRLDVLISRFQRRSRPHIDAATMASSPSSHLHWNPPQGRGRRQIIFVSFIGSVSEA